MILGDFSACIFIDDQELPEYDVVVSSTPAENRITCWIPSAEGKKFGVRTKFLAKRISWGFANVFVDGVPCLPCGVNPDYIGTMEYTYLSNGHFKRDFMFSKLEFTDDDSMLDDQGSNGIGQITVEVALGKYTKVEQAVDSRQTTLRVEEGKVHERSKKACSHRVAFGEEVPHKLSLVASIFTQDSSPKTIFVFKYTRLDILQAMGVAPPTAIKAETEDHNDEIEVIDEPSESSLSDDVKPLARIQELEMELQRLRAQVEDRKPSRVKLEDGGSRRKRTIMEVIDLTED
ncbi:hypothetical protein CY34DRAFT_802706 [Suillus luteus UH-Slu-Lm8-n1]|uniref:DUF7918 domain-containing protein n=1 Tax=Suillus luteus UH-Slu-Lm8-n1 TaxID=930992 RepID=A0A0D0BM75_9AGAM|nr:hypothetical protein CY34DRAFT_802706 [Suillus luteus UH-Slu-Lm8-n1]